MCFDSRLTQTPSLFFQQSWSLMATVVTTRQKTSVAATLQKQLSLQRDNALTLIKGALEKNLQHLFKTILHHDALG